MPLSPMDALSGFLRLALAPLIILSPTLAACAGAGAPPANGLRFIVFGGSEEPGDDSRLLVAQMVKAHPDLVAHAGGMVGGTRITEWLAFHQFAEPLTSLFPFYGCRGRGERRPLVQPRNGAPEPRLLGETFFSFDYKGAHFVFLDTEARLEKDHPESAWLAEDLASAGDKPIFAFGHRALFGAAERYIMRMGHYWWHPLFVKYRVRVVFSGARHLYHRLYQDGVAYVITGGGGGVLDPVMARRQVGPGDVAASFRHFIEVTVAGGEIRCRAVDSEGKTRDEFAVRAEGPLGPVGP